MPDDLSLCVNLPNVGSVMSDELLELEPDLISLDERGRLLLALAQAKCDAGQGLNEDETDAVRAALVELLGRSNELRRKWRGVLDLANRRAV